MNKKLAFKLTTIICLFLSSSQVAHAYLDPGTGSILIQSLIAVVAATSIVIKTYWYRIKTFFSKPSENTDDELSIEKEKYKKPDD